MSDRLPVGLFMQATNQKIIKFFINLNSIHVLIRIGGTRLVKEVIEVNFVPRTSSLASGPCPKAKRRFRCFAEHCEEIYLNAWSIGGTNFFVDQQILLLICGLVTSVNRNSLLIFRVVFQSSGQHRKLSLVVGPTRRRVMCKMLLT